MLKYAKITNEETKQCEVGLGTNITFYQSIGMVEMDIEQAYDGHWYISGYAPKPTYTYNRKINYPPLAEQLDMIYHDLEDGTNNWQTLIKSIKEKYPKE